MQNKGKERRGVVALLLLLAMLTVSVAAILPVVSSAGVEEFADFGYQTPKDYDMIDATTNLRFVFTIPLSKLGDYTNVGFVISKADSTPEIGETGVGVAPATAVYSTITADGKSSDASEGRKWVAVKVKNIPQSYFDGDIYVRPFVTDAEGTRYGETASISVWSANAIEYHSNWEKSNDSPYNLSGTFGVKKEAKTLYSGDTRYYPNEDNGYAGNDMLVEFSFLYNDTMGNAKDGILTVMYIEDYNLFNIDLKAGKISARLRAKPDDKGDDVLLYESAEAVDGKVSIGGYGWHRFGVRIHQEAVNDNGVEDYKIIATAYLDGEKIFQVDKTDWVKGTYSGSKTKTGKLFHLYPHTNRLVYGAIANSQTCDLYVMVEDIYKSSANAGYLVLQDLSMSCAQTFKQQVTKVDAPASKTYKSADGKTMTGDVYFTAAEAHEHDWDGVYTMTQSPTLLADGLKSEHCTICGAGRTVVATSAELTPVILNGKTATAPEGWGDEKQLLSSKTTLKFLADDNGHFYPTDGNEDGNDLLVEFSILWNGTVPGGDLNPGVFSGDSARSIAYIYFQDCIVDGDARSCGEIELNDGGTGAKVLYQKPGAQYANIGDFGWHRIGLRYHQTAEIVNDAVVYTLTYTIYVDGVKVSEVLTGKDRFVDSGYLLYTAEIEDGKLKYSDNTNSKRYYSWIQVNNFFGKDSDRYVILADYSINSAHEFVQQVKPAEGTVYAPIDLDYLNNFDDPAVMHYQPIATP